MAEYPGTLFSGHTSATALAADDRFLFEDASETVVSEKIKKIELADKFGATTEIPVSLYQKVSGENCFHTLERDGDAKALLSATVASVNVGSFTNHQVKLYVGNSGKATVNTDGTFSNAAAYTYDVNGMTFRDTKTKDDGTFGYDSSSKRYKIIIGPINDISWIYNIEIVRYKSKINPAIERVGMIAEQVETLNADVCYYETYQIIDNELVPISTDEIENWLEIKRAGEKNKITTIVAKKYTDEKKETTKDEEIEITSVVQGINNTEFIPYLIQALQDQKSKNDELEARIEKLERK